MSAEPAPIAELSPAFVRQAQGVLEARAQFLTSDLSARGTLVRPLPEPEDGTLEQLELGAVNRALGRIDAGLFGLCEVCHGPIELSRLAAVPWSRSCAPCVSFCEQELRSADGSESDCAECAGCLAQAA